MTRKNIKLAFRILNRQAYYSIIKIASLTLGLTTTILTLVWINNERNVDRFHENLPDLYRVTNHLNYGDSERHSRGCGYPVASTLKQDFPEIKYASKFRRSRSLVSFGEVKFWEEAFYYADPDFLQMFSFELIAGNKETALSEKNSVILTEKAVRKYFGNENPMGKSITINGGDFYRVTGVLKTITSPTNLNFDFLSSFASIEDKGIKTHWTAWMYPTYAMLQPNVSTSDLNSKLRDWAKNYHDYQSGYELQELKDVHLYNLGDNTVARKLYLFGALAVIVLLLACFNYANLNLAQIGERTTEIGIKKVFGIGKRKVISQFLAESFLAVFISMLLSVVLLALFFPIFNNLVQEEIAFGNLLQMNNILTLFLILTGTAFLIGYLPARFISSMPTVNILKSVFAGGSKLKIQTRLGQILIIVQFMVVSILIMGVLVISGQMRYMSNSPLGINTDNLLCVQIHDENHPWNVYSLLKEEMGSIPGVSGITACSNLPFRSVPGEMGSYYYPGRAEDDMKEIRHLAVDENFFQLMGATQKEGRFFDAKYATDTTSFVLNETAANMYYADSPLNSQFKLLRKEGSVVGVVKDFHYLSLRSEIDPLVIHKMPFDYWAYNTYMLLKLDEENMIDVLPRLTAVWNKIQPAYPFEFEFMDDIIDNNYQSEKNQNKSMSLFSVLALLISCLGLFGITSLTLKQRLKEVSIRKVLGAGTVDLLPALFKRQMLSVMIAILLGMPAGYFLMQSWLGNFAYRIPLGPVLFLKVLLITFSVVILTIGIEYRKLLRRNPIQSLRKG